MKRILVIDESEVIRETLALILGREFTVSKRALRAGELPFVEASSEPIDLLIFGVAPQLGAETSHLVRFAAQLPFAVLFLVETKTTARAITEHGHLACLIKPFNPYELHERVGELLARHAGATRLRVLDHDEKPHELKRYIAYPYVSRSTASLVERFAAVRLPILIFGEIGCGQDRVARGMRAAQPNPGFTVLMSGADVSVDYLAQKRIEISTKRMLDTTTTMLIENLEKSSPATQSLLLDFLDEQEEQGTPLRYLTTASGELLERVYRGEFLEALYYKLATLTLKLLPLRDRCEDIPALANWFARRYAMVLAASEAEFSPQALSQLMNYLWFGNLKEMETVIARTLAVCGGGRIDAGDLVFDFQGADRGASLGVFSPQIQSDMTMDLPSDQPRLQVYTGSLAGASSANGHGQTVDLSLVIHELAHELKNPMVTIKTFAQLLGDRYEDENFRARFQEIVGGDIERMDDLLEAMIEFADFSRPKRTKVSLAEKLRIAVSELHQEAVKRQTRFAWKGDGVGHEISADESQVSYILKNLLLAALSQVKMGSEIEIDTVRAGVATFIYLREGARVASITHYLGGASGEPNAGILPLRILLAKQLVERNGGSLAINHSDPEKDLLRLEFPLGEHGKET
jgi:DNA-binding NtrC family response regulator